jgi:hypothetical protein
VTSDSRASYRTVFSRFSKARIRVGAASLKSFLAISLPMSKAFSTSASVPRDVTLSKTLHMLQYLSSRCNFHSPLEIRLASLPEFWSDNSEIRTRIAIVLTSEGMGMDRRTAKKRAKRFVGCARSLFAMERKRWNAMLGDLIGDAMFLKVRDIQVIAS